MGSLVNPPWVRALAWAGALLVLGLNAFLLWQGLVARLQPGFRRQA